MSYPGITSDTTHHCAGAGTTTLESSSGMLSALIATCGSTTPGTIVLHDSLDPGTDPHPLLTLYVAAYAPLAFCRPYPQGLYFASGLSAVLTGATTTLHVTTHAESSI